jgi:hypothetical protein
MNYDAKAWEFMTKHGSPGAWFWNVGGDPKPELEDTKIITDSRRDWGEIRDEKMKQPTVNS